MIQISSVMNANKINELKNYQELLADISIPSYCIYHGGMGCNIYCRRKDNNSEIEKFIMHPDDWGQYPEGVDNKPKLYEFIEGYKYLGPCDMRI